MPCSAVWLQTRLFRLNPASHHSVKSLLQYPGIRFFQGVWEVWSPVDVTHLVLPRCTDWGFEYSLFTLYISDLRRHFPGYVRLKSSCTQILHLIKKNKANYPQLLFSGYTWTVQLHKGIPLFHHDKLQLRCAPPGTCNFSLRRPFIMGISNAGEASLPVKRYISINIPFCRPC